MRKVILIISVLLLVGCGTYRKYPKKIFVDLCESYPIDSINLELAKQCIPLRFLEGERVCQLKVGKYVIVMSKEEGPCISFIVETQDYYMIISTEYYVVGYDKSLIYDKEHFVLYQTDLYNVNYSPYNVLYETYDLNKSTIDVRYEDNSIEHVNLNKCASDTIELW